VKVYLASVLYNDFREEGNVWPRLVDREKQAVKELKHVLDSYHYVGNDRMVGRIRSSGRRIFLDSGAFSAFTQGIQMDLPAYCQYIKDNGDFVERDGDHLLASVLDAIGDADETYRNQRRMEHYGVQPLPCYHFGEPEHVLEHYVLHYGYITIGGMVPISTPQLRIWLDRIWGKLLTKPDGSPRIKVHGFGLTSVPLMERYPWHSVDSSSWVQLGGMGNIFLPPWGTLAISERHPWIKDAGKHIDNLPTIQQECVVSTIEGMGFDMQRLRVEHLSRKVFNMVTYSSYVADSAAKRFIEPQPVLF
jgi:hypothetical protein